MTDQSRSAADGKKKKESLARSQTSRGILLYLGLTVLVAALFMISIIPEQYDLTVGQTPTVTIAAPKDIVDTVATEQRRKEAADAVQPVYRFEEGVTESVLDQYSQVIAQLRLVRQYGDTLEKDGTTGYTRDELNYAGSMLSLITLTRNQLSTLLAARQTDFDTMSDTLYAALKNVMDGHISEGSEEDAIHNIGQIVGYKVDTNLLQNVAIPILREVVRPNMLIDVEATEKARQQARDAVADVVIQQGQNIVAEGEGRLTAGQIKILDELGLLNNDRFDMTGYAGTAVLVVLAMVLLYLVLAFISRGLTHELRRMLILCLSFLATMLLCMVAGLFNQPYLMPAVLAVLLLTTLDSLRCGLSVNTALSVLVSLYALGISENRTQVMVRIFVTVLLGGTAAGLIVRRSSSRVKPLIAGVAAAVVNFCAVSAIGLITETATSQLWLDAALSMSGPIIAGLLAMALQPMAESLFNLPSPVRLLELSNPNNPLLKRLMMEAPGTYHHSILVANLAEAAAEAVGANPLLARVGAYYHDIGKLKRPQYFSENQTGGENIHDHTPPETSAKILTAHTRDGLALAREYRLPAEIQRIIADHHGNSPVMYFYHKAMQLSGGKPVDINAFRYDGNRPSTKEAAIIMMCDTIEAAVRSRKDQMTQEQLEDYIVKLVRGKLSDGQLNQAPLTLRDIDDICTACSVVLKGVNHERVSYPGDKQPKNAPDARREAQQKKRPRRFEDTTPLVAAQTARQQPVRRADDTAPVIVTPSPAAQSVVVDDILQPTKPEEIETENAPAFLVPDPAADPQPEETPNNAEQDLNDE